jgi:hypothetical protein
MRVSEFLMNNFSQKRARPESPKSKSTITHDSSTEFVLKLTSEMHKDRLRMSSNFLSSRFIPFPQAAK